RVAWIVAHGAYRDNPDPVRSLLQFHAPCGPYRRDRIANPVDRFFYLSLVNLHNDTRGYTTGTDFNNFRPGISVDRFQNNQIAWEIDDKMNLGMELGCFDKISMEADTFSALLR